MFPSESPEHHGRNKRILLDPESHDPPPLVARLTNLKAPAVRPLLLEPPRLRLRIDGDIATGGAPPLCPLEEVYVLNTKAKNNFRFFSPCCVGESANVGSCDVACLAWLF